MTQILQIESRPVDSLVPYVNNARTHSDEQVAQIAASIREFGWTNPILVDGERGVIAGHGRLLAARKLGLDAVPVIELAHLSVTQKRAYILADNRLAENVGWDNELLILELEDLKLAEFDLNLIGFSAAELDVLIAGGNTESSQQQDAENQIINEQFLVVVTCKDDADQCQVLDKMMREGYECRALTS